MPNYIVIENTPGYMPEEDDPFITDVYTYLQGMRRAQLLAR